MVKAIHPILLGIKQPIYGKKFLPRESLANIIQHFVRFDGKAKDALSKRTLFFLATIKWMWCVKY